MQVTKIGRMGAILAGLLIIAGCTQLGLRYASLKTSGKQALPVIQDTTLEAWQSERANVRARLADIVYGPWPEGLAVSIGETRIADEAYLEGRGILEETPITLGKGPTARTFHLAVAYPKAQMEKGPVPVVIGQTFSNNCFVFQSLALTGPNGAACEQTRFGGFVGWAVHNILGRYIAKAPIEAYFDRGLAYANFYASEIVPDSNKPAQIVMAALRQENDVEATSALSYWAYGFSAAIDHFEADPARVRTDRIAIMGHSRHGKAALWAGAWERRVAAIVSHQSGFGGSALSRSRSGERIDRVYKNYPYWFDQRLAEYVADPETLPVDQHQLIALSAPIPVLLGNGRRDVWSDPNSSYIAAAGADPIYELYGVEGLNQAGLRGYNPQAELAFHMRPGAHGITPEDIDAFMAFFEAHLLDG